jgi:hypothetical protein
VHNNSDLLIEAGSWNNGYVGYYAKIIVDHGEVSCADDGYNYTLTNDGFLFREKDAKYELIYYVGGEETVTLPTDFNGNSYSIYNMRGVINIIIPEGFTEISDYAFWGCSSLTSVVIPDSVTSIGSYAFYGCNSLTSVVIPDSVTSIGEWTFGHCTSLTSIIIPDSILMISDYAFMYCNNLPSITFEGTVEQWNLIDLEFLWHSYCTATEVTCSNGSIPLEYFEGI